MSPDASVVMIKKRKIVPEFSEIGSLLEEHKGCGAFVASAEMYPTKEELQNRILSISSKLLHNQTDNMKSKAKRGLIGTTYYGGAKK